MVPFSKSVVIISLGLSLSSWTANGRTWTNVKGSTISAQLKAVNGEELTLLLEDGREVKINQSILCGSDIEYIQAWVNADGKLEDPDFHLNSDEPNKLVRVHDEWGSQWPTIIEEIESPIVNKNTSVQDVFIYESGNFIYQSAFELQESELNMLSSRFENALNVLKQLPINIIVARRPSRKFIVNLCYDENEMNDFQGVRDARVSFLPTSFQVLMKRDAKLKPVELEKIRPLFALTHWANQVVDRDHWFVDGLSYYLKLAPEKKGAINFLSMPEVIASKVAKSVKLGKTSLPSLSELFELTSSHVTKENHHSAFSDDIDHQAATLVLAYFIHSDEGKNLETLIEYLKLTDASKNEQAKKSLFKNGTVQELEAKIQKFWKSKGLNLKFQTK